MKSKLARQILLTLLLSLVSVSATVTCVTCSRTVPLSQCSDIYRRYAGNPDIGAAYIKDYRINDTMTLCATVLQANSDSGWATLQDDFHIDFLEDDTNKEAIEKGTDVLLITTIQETGDEAVASYRDRNICIFHIEDSATRHQVQHALITKMFHSITNEKSFNDYEKDN